MKYNSLIKNVYLAFSNRGTIIFLYVALPLFMLACDTDVQAQTSMTNEEYKIRWPNLNAFPDTTAGENISPDSTYDQIVPGYYSGSNYEARAGFEYISSVLPLTFNISSIFIDFGPITPGDPVTRSNNISISNGSAYGYSLFVQEDHPLRASDTGINIPDTTCDSGTCDETTASEWINLTTFGFGYRCDNISGSDCNPDFTTVEYYKQFASNENSEQMQPVMTGRLRGNDSSGKITYKVNVSASQPAGTYLNTIRYIALPSI